MLASEQSRLGLVCIDLLTLVSESLFTLYFPNYLRLLLKDGPSFAVITFFVSLFHFSSVLTVKECFLTSVREYPLNSESLLTSCLSCSGSFSVGCPSEWSVLVLSVRNLWTSARSFSPLLSYEYQSSLLVLIYGSLLQQNYLFFSVPDP